MATAGIEIRNTSALTIDDTFSNFGLRTKLTVNPTTPVATLTGTVYYVDVAIPGTAPVVALYCSTAVVTPGVGVLTSGTMRVFSSVSGAAVELFVFDIFSALPVSSTYGFQVFTGGGALVFDALSKYMRIGGVVANSNVANVYGNHIFESGRKYAVLFNNMPYDTQSTYQPPPGSPTGPPWIVMDSTMVAGVRGIASGITVSGMYTYFYTDPSYPGTDQSFTEAVTNISLLVVDVTGY